MMRSRLGHRPAYARLKLAMLAALWLLHAGTAHANNPFLRAGQKRMITQITISGNERTRDYVIRRELGIRVGDEYDPDVVNAAWERLEALPFIAYVDIETDRPKPDEVTLTIQVEEDRLFSWSTGVDYERRYDAWLLGWQGRLTNLTGRAESLELQLQLYDRRLGRLIWSNPGILGPARLGVFAAASWQRYDFEYEPFRFTDWELSTGARRDFGRWLRVQASYHWREIQVDDLDADPATLDVRIPGEFTSKDPAIELSLIHDSRDLRFYPREGVYARTDLRFAGIGIEGDYTVFQSSVSAFHRLPADMIVSGHAGYRIASDPLPFYERSYLGGPMTIRGVGFGAVRGAEAFRATIEVRHPLILIPLREGRAVGMGLHAFHDWGTAWEHGQGIDAHKPNWSYGLGAHFSLNTHDYRLEWAHADDGDNVFVFEDSFTF